METVMKLSAGALTCALLLVSFSSTDTGFLDRTVTIAGEAYRYQVYVPLEWTPNQKWPVVIYLHGSGPRGSDGMSQVNGAHAYAIRGDRSRFPAVFVLPQARVGTSWGAPAMQDMVLAEVDAAIKEFNGDPDRVYLTGFSMGGAGVVRMAGRWPDRFAALVDVSGPVRPDMPGRPQDRIDEDLVTHPFLALKDPYGGAARVLHRLPIWVFHSAADSQVPVTESRQLVAALKAAGASVRYTEYPGADHNTTNINVWAEQELVPWLLAQRRTGTK
jgi:predicted peptidase